MYIYIFFLAFLFQMNYACQLDSAAIMFLAHNIEQAEAKTLAVPKWPEKVQEKCTTITALASGPYKGKQAKIIRSGWGLWGIDSIGARNIKVGNIRTAGPLVWKFYVESSLKEYAPSLYYGKIADDDLGIIIPQSWLSDEDVKNLFGFHRYELEVFGDQLFTDTEVSKLFKNTIQEHLFGLDGFMVASFFLALKSKYGKEVLDYIRNLTSDWLLISPSLCSEFARMRKQIKPSLQGLTKIEIALLKNEETLLKKLQTIFYEKALTSLEYSEQQENYLYLLPLDLRGYVLTVLTSEKSHNVG